MLDAEAQLDDPIHLRHRKKMRYTSYTVQNYDTWPSIAYAAYGQAERWPEITAANPGVIMSAIPPAGIVISIPVIDPISVVAGDNVGLPPWRR